MVKAKKAFVEALVLEASGGPKIDHALAQAHALWRDVDAGACLEPRAAGSLLALLANARAFYRKQGAKGTLLRTQVVKAIAAQAIRGDDPSLMNALAALGDEVLLDALRADVRVRIGPRVLATLLDATEDGDARMQASFASRLEHAVFFGTDVTLAAPRLVAELSVMPTGRGHARVDVAACARSAIFAAMAQDTAFRGAHASANRKALQRRADAAFRKPLVARAREHSEAGATAHRILVAVAAVKGRWADVDASRDRASATVAGLLDAMHHTTRHGDAKRASSGAEIVRRIGALRGALGAAARADVDARLARDAKQLGVSVSSDAGIRALVTELVKATPKQRRQVKLRMLDALRADPSAARELPALASVARKGPFDELAGLHLEVILTKRDAKGLATHLAAVRKRANATSHALGVVANRKGRATYASVVAAYLEDAEPLRRFWATYFFRKLALEEAGELASWAAALLARSLDGARAAGQSISTEGQRAWRAAIAATKQRARFVTAAKKALAKTLDAAEKTKLRALIRATLPEAAE